MVFRWEKDIPDKKMSHFLNIIHRKIYLLIGKISKFDQIFANGGAKQTETSEEPFFQISTSNKI
jgi:hypothetical protein